MQLLSALSRTASAAATQALRFAAPPGFAALFAGIGEAATDARQAAATPGNDLPLAADPSGVMPGTPPVAPPGPVADGAPAPMLAPIVAQAIAEVVTTPVPADRAPIPVVDERPSADAAAPAKGPPPSDPVASIMRPVPVAIVPPSPRPTLARTPREISWVAAPTDTGRTLDPVPVVADTASAAPAPARSIEPAFRDGAARPVVTETKQAATGPVIPASAPAGIDPPRTPVVAMPSPVPAPVSVSVQPPLQSTGLPRPDQSLDTGNPSDDARIGRTVATDDTLVATAPATPAAPSNDAPVARAEPERGDIATKTHRRDARLPSLLPDDDDAMDESVDADRDAIAADAPRRDSLPSPVHDLTVAPLPPAPTGSDTIRLPSDEQPPADGSAAPVVVAKRHRDPLFAPAPDLPVAPVSPAPTGGPANGQRSADTSTPRAAAPAIRGVDAPAVATPAAGPPSAVSQDHGADRTPCLVQQARDPVAVVAPAPSPAPTRIADIAAARPADVAAPSLAAAMPPLPPVVAAPVALPRQPIAGETAAPVITIAAPLAKASAAPVTRIAGTPVAPPRPEAAVPVEALAGDAALPAPRRRDDDAPAPTLGTPVPDAATLRPVAAPVAAGPAMLDTRSDTWMQGMIDRIETLRDTATGTTETRIRLSPQALGDVEVAITTADDGSVQVRFASENADAGRLLADAQPRLLQLAEARGLKLTGMQVDVGAQQQQRPSPDQPARQPRAPRATAGTATTADPIHSDHRIA